jgi:hypothetical protein
MQATNAAMEQIAESIRERDVRIVALEQLVTDLSREGRTPGLDNPYAGARHRRPRADTPDAMDPVRSTAAATPVTSAEPGTSAAGAPVEEETATLAAWPPFEPGRPVGDVPPEESHD